jgi:hypothetical protein
MIPVRAHVCEAGGSGKVVVSVRRRAAPAKLRQHNGKSAVPPYTTQHLKTRARAGRPLILPCDRYEPASTPCGHDVTQPPAHAPRPRQRLSTATGDQVTVYLVPDWACYGVGRHSAT